MPDVQLVSTRTSAPRVDSSGERGLPLLPVVDSAEGALAALIRPQVRHAPAAARAGEVAVSVDLASEAMDRDLRPSTWSSIESYARLRMAPAEIQEAALLDRGLQVPISAIENALSGAFRSGLLPRRTSEERRSSRGASFRSDDQRRAHVRAWLQVAGLLAANGRAPLPLARTDWGELIRAQSAVQDEAKRVASLCRLADHLVKRRAASSGPQRDLWSLIRPFAALRLTPREICQAIHAYAGHRFSLHEVQTELQYARRRHLLTGPSPEEARDARIRVSFATDADVTMQLERHLEAAAVLLFDETVDWPTTRPAWREVVGALRGSGCLTDALLHWHLVRSIHGRAANELADLTDASGVSAERAFLAEARDGLLSQVLGSRPQFQPAAVAEQQLLFELYWARGLWAATGEKALADSLLVGVRNSDPELKERLGEQIRVVCSCADTAGRRARTLPEVRRALNAAPQPCGSGLVLLLSALWPRPQRCAHCGGALYPDTGRDLICSWCGRTSFSTA